MKTKFRNLAVLFAAALALVFGVVLFTACDDGDPSGNGTQPGSETRYVYVGVDGSAGGMEGVMDEMYAGSEIYFADGKIVWEMNGSVQTLQYTQENGKYIVNLTEAQGQALGMIFEIEGDTLKASETVDGEIVFTLIFAA